MTAQKLRYNLINFININILIFYYVVSTFAFFSFSRFSW